MEAGLLSEQVLLPSIESASYEADVGGRRLRGRGRISGEGQLGRLSSANLSRCRQHNLADSHGGIDERWWEAKYRGLERCREGSVAKAFLYNLRRFPAPRPRVQPWLNEARWEADTRTQHGGGRWTGKSSWERNTQKTYRRFRFSTYWQSAARRRSVSSLACEGGEFRTIMRVQELAQGRDWVLIGYWYAMVHERQSVVANALA